MNRKNDLSHQLSGKTVMRRNIHIESGVLEQTVRSAQKDSSDSTSIKLNNLSAKPLVSVLIANHNYGRYLADALHSIQTQTYRTFEIIICDDGSTDSSAEIYKKRSTTDQRIQIINKERGGQGSALTQVFDVSRGDIICFLDADDIFLPQKLEIIVDAFLAHPQAGVCTHFVQPVSEVRKTLGTRFPRSLDSGWLAAQSLTNGGSVCYPPTSGLSIRREVGEYLFPISEEFFRACDAYITGVSIFITQFVAVPKILSYYRWHGKNISGGQAYSRKILAEMVTIHEAIYREQKKILKRRFGVALADHLKLDDKEIYLRTLIWLHIFSGKGRGHIDGIRLKEIKNRLPKTFTNQMLFALLHLPSAVPILLNKLSVKRYYYFRWSAPLKVNNIS
ncbi:glycosyltransferase family 2 protein [Candidatus Neomarinimicrobiota bacterium]